MFKISAESPTKNTKLMNYMIAKWTKDKQMRKKEKGLNYISFKYCARRGLQAFRQCGSRDRLQYGPKA